MNIVQERKLADRLAGAIRAWVDDTGLNYTFEQQVAALRTYLGSTRLPVDLVWQMAKAPWATGPDAWAERNHETFWHYLEALEDPQSPGIVVGATDDD